jgi:hypothetical protein
MTPTTIAGLVAASVWLGGTITAGAFGMRQSAAPPTEAAPQTQPPSFGQIYERIPAPAPLASETVMWLPNTTIVGTAPVRTPKPVREPKCGAWRPLEQGSNMVQMCE